MRRFPERAGTRASGVTVYRTNRHPPGPTAISRREEATSTSAGPSGRAFVVTDVRALLWINEPSLRDRGGTGSKV